MTPVFWIALVVAQHVNRELSVRLNANGRGVFEEHVSEPRRWS